MAFYILLTLTLTFVPMNFSHADAWPEEARAYLHQLPQKQLTLDVVVSQALKYSDSFQIPLFEALRAQAIEDSALSYEDLRLRASYAYTDNQNEPLIPAFMPNSTVGWESKVSAEQFFATGTALSIEGSHRPQTIGFLTNPTFEAIETRLTLGIQQNVLGDFFGSSYRNLVRSSESQKSALLFGAFNKIEETTLQIIGLYYQAWLKKEMTSHWDDVKKRKLKLVKILQNQLRKGIVESSDVLQVESASLQTEIEYENSKRDLQNLWESLVTNLKLPRSFLTVNAVEIPMVLDQPEARSLDLCAKMSFVDVEKNSKPLQEAKEMVTASEKKYAAYKEKLLPELKLVGSYASNSIEQSNSLTGYQPQASRTFEDVSDLKNPTWSAGVQLSFPLQNRAQKAQYLTAKADYEQAKLRQSILFNDLENKWKQTCSLLKQKMSERDKLKEMSQKNRRRVELDNQRFSVGRLKAFQWVQTEDDEANALLKYKLSEVEVRNIAWDIQRQTGHMGDFLKTFLPTLVPSHE